MVSIAVPSFLSTSKQVVSHTPILISLLKMVSIAVPFPQTVWLQMEVSAHHVSLKKVLVSCTFLQCLDSTERYLVKTAFSLLAALAVWWFQQTDLTRLYWLAHGSTGLHFLSLFKPFCLGLFIYKLAWFCRFFEPFWHGIRR